MRRRRLIALNLQPLYGIYIFYKEKNLGKNRINSIKIIILLSLIKSFN